MKGLDHENGLNFPRLLLFRAGAMNGQVDQKLKIQCSRKTIGLPVNDFSPPRSPSAPARISERYFVQLSHL